MRCLEAHRHHWVTCSSAEGNIACPSQCGDEKGRSFQIPAVTVVRWRREKDRWAVVRCGEEESTRLGGPVVGTTSSSGTVNEPSTTRREGLEGE
jgi:hypothetical protein